MRAPEGFKDSYKCPTKYCTGKAHYVDSKYVNPRHGWVARFFCARCGRYTEKAF